jgi:hypothetical protein
MGIVMEVPRQRDLLELIGALSPAGRFTSSLDGGKQQRHEDADNRDNDQQLDQRERA